ncbi:hypothetical protein DFQ26_005763, partial [Actinomortierella ambigua]
MSSPPQSISDLLGTTRSTSGGDGTSSVGGGGTGLGGSSGDHDSSSGLGSSAFLDPTFSLQNPFAEDIHPHPSSSLGGAEGFPATSPVLRPSQSLNFHETYASSASHGFGVSSQPELTATTTTTKRATTGTGTRTWKSRVDDSDDDDDDDDDGGDGDDSDDDGHHHRHHRIVDPALQRASSTIHKSFSAMNLASPTSGGYPATG